MGIKNERFVLRSHETENKDRRLKKILTVTVLLSAIIVPFINEGIIQTLWTYINGDIQYIWLAYILQYLIVIIQYTAKYTAMAAMCVSLVSFGYKKSRGAVALFLLSAFTTYILAQYGSWLFQYNNNLLDTTDILDVAEYAFNYSVFAVFDFVKSCVLVFLCAITVKKMKKSEAAIFIPDESVRSECLNQNASGKSSLSLKPFLKFAAKKESVYRKFSLYCMWVMIIFDIILTAYGKTLPMILTDGAPERFSDVITLCSGYVLIAPGNVLGFFVMICMCLYLSFYKSKPRI